MRKLIITFHFFGLMLAAYAADVTEMPFSRVISEVEICSFRGKVRLPAVEGRLLLNENGMQQRGNLLVVFDPVTGYFFSSHFFRWPQDPEDPKYHLADGIRFSPWHALISTKDGMSFWTVRYLNFDVLTSKDTAKDLVGAYEKVLSELRMGGTPNEVMSQRRTLKAIGYEELPQMQSMDARVRSVSVKSIDRVDQGFRFRLSGRAEPDNPQTEWIADIVIGDDLKVKERIRIVEVK